MPPGEVWKAKGKISPLSINNDTDSYLRQDTLMHALINHAQTALGPYRDQAAGVPDPSFVLQLPDDIYSGSNLYAVQLSFDGEFQFDVYFDSGSAKQKLSCK